MKEQIQNQQEQLNKMADELDSLQAKENEGRGITCVKDVVTSLRRGDLDSAKQVCSWDHDKIGNYPEIKEFIKNNLFNKDKEHPWSVLERFEK